MAPRHVLGEGDAAGAEMSNVVTAPFRREHLGEMASKIEAVVYEYADRISLAEAIGILEIVKAQILEDQHK